MINVQNSEAPPQETLAQNETPSSDVTVAYEIKLSETTLSLELVSSFTLCGNSHRVHFAVDGKISCVSSLILMDGATYDVKVNIEKAFVEFLPIKENNIPIESTIPFAQKLWTVLKSALDVAEKNYTPDIQASAENFLLQRPIDIQEVARELSTDEKILTISDKWAYFKIVFLRVTNYLNYVQKHQLKLATIDQRLLNLVDFSQNCLKEVENLLLDQNTRSQEQIKKIHALKNETKRIADEIVTIKECAHEYLAKPYVDSPVSISLWQIGKGTFELLYFFIRGNIPCKFSFTDQGEIKFENYLRSDVPLTKKKKDEIVEMFLHGQLNYSPATHEEAELRSQKVADQNTDDNIENIKAEFIRFKKFSERTLFYHRFLTENASCGSLPSDKKAAYKFLSSNNFMLLEKRFRFLWEKVENSFAINRTEVELIKIRAALHAMMDTAKKTAEKIDTDLKATQEKKNKNPPPTEQEIKEAEQLQKLLLEEEPKKLGKKRAPELTAESEKEKSAPPKKPTQKVAPASREEITFNKFFDILNKLMTDLKKSGNTATNAAIKERFDALKEYYDKNNLSSNEHVKNQLERLHMLWVEIQKAIPVEQKAAQAETQVNDAPITSPRSPAATNGLFQTRRHNPYAPVVTPPTTTPQNCHDPYAPVLVFRS